jgi:hypothetical protein
MESHVQTSALLHGKYGVLQLVSIACSFALGAWILYANKLFYHDDAYITLRYARNFLEGHGIVWNAGEYVQGYTNFLHLVLISGLGLAGVDLVWASRVIGVLTFGLLVLVLQLFLRRSSRQSLQERNLFHLPVILTLASAPLIVWSIGGLEGTLFALLTSTGCLTFLAALDQSANWRLPVASGVCLALAYLAHPTGLVFIGLSMIWLLITWKSRLIRSIVAFAAPCFVIVTTYTLWQFFYYGDVVPNTFYTKAGNFTIQRLIKGLRYMVSYAQQPPYLPILILLAVGYSIVAKKWHWHSKLTYLALIISGYTSFLVFIGGDHMQAFRLFLPLIVPLSYTFYLLLTYTVDTSNRIAVSLLTVMVLFLSGMQLGQARLNPKKEDPASRTGTIIGKYIAKAWPEGSLVALNTAGSTPYYAPQHRYIDMLGLNDRHIAKRIITKIELRRQNASGHLKGDGNYVLSMAPDFIIVGPAHGTDISDPWFLSDLEMSRAPRFAQKYIRKQVRLNQRGEVIEKGGTLFAYYQRQGNS